MIDVCPAVTEALDWLPELLAVAFFADLVIAGGLGAAVGSYLSRRRSKFDV